VKRLKPQSSSMAFRYQEHSPCCKYLGNGASYSIAVTVKMTAIPNSIERVLLAGMLLYLICVETINGYRASCTGATPWGAPHGILGGPWPTQKFLWVGHNAFGPPKKCRCKIKYSYCFQCRRNFFVNFRLDSIVRLTVSILPADCGVTS
jgi:hypothetical protein